MSIMKTALASSALLLTAAIFPAAVPALQASTLDEQTSMTFSAPFEIPGQVLPAGTYTFKSPLDARNVVQILNRDQTKVYATLQTVPDYVPTAPEKTVVQFEERSSSGPDALHLWFYPGDPCGHEFLYKKGL